MSLATFIKQNRAEIDAAIRRVLDDPTLKFSDRERRLWVLNDQSLYYWARREGVKI
jgi:hypothetical protein